MIFLRRIDSLSSVSFIYSLMLLRYNRWDFSQGSIS